MLQQTFEFGMCGKALKKNLVRVSMINLREYGFVVEGKVYGGGPGRVLTFPPFAAAVEQFKRKHRDGVVVMPAPFGEELRTPLITELNNKDILFLCGRYQGIDERINCLVDYHISLGSYTISCGELAAAVIIDALVRRIPQVLNSPLSLATDDYNYPVYTVPQSYKGLTVPAVLLNGNHKEIAVWRKEKLKKGHDKRSYKQPEKKTSLSS